jgi:hypothetical protein
MDKDILSELTKININNLDFNKHEHIKSTIVTLFNIIENISAQNKQLAEKVQSLTNEINELKGEKGKPNIKPNVKKKIM